MYDPQELPDDFSNPQQRAFAHSQTQHSIENDTKKAEALAKQGKYVVLIKQPIHCSATDGVLGVDVSIDSSWNTNDEAMKRLEKLSKDGMDVDLVTPESITPKEVPPQTLDKDMPFECVKGNLFKMSIIKM